MFLTSGLTAKPREKTKGSVNQSKAEAIVAQLLTNAAGLRYGSVAVTVKIHDGRVVSVSYATTEQTKEQLPIKNE
jgi:hypothetical protein